MSKPTLRDILVERRTDWVQGRHRLVIFAAVLTFVLSIVVFVSTSDRYPVLSLVLLLTAEPVWKSLRDPAKAALWWHRQVSDAGLTRRCLSRGSPQQDQNPSNSTWVGDVVAVAATPWPVVRLQEHLLTFGPDQLTLRCVAPGYWYVTVEFDSVHGIDLELAEEAGILRALAENGTFDYLDEPKFIDYLRLGRFGFIP